MVANTDIKATSKPAAVKVIEKSREAPAAPARGSNRAPDNVVFVGKKPAMSYVLAVITQFSSGMKEVHVRARGMSISRAVDVAEVVRNKFIQNLKPQIDIGTEVMEDRDKNRMNISTIDIKLMK